MTSRTAIMSNILYDEKNTHAKPLSKGLIAFHLGLAGLFMTASY